MAISRKTYYQWERRALRALMQGLQNGRQGRPRLGPSPQIQRLHRKIKRLKQRVKTTEQLDRLRQIVTHLHQPQSRAEKGGLLETLLTMSQSVLHDTGLSPRPLCRGLGLAYASFVRWCRRLGGRSATAAYFHDRRRRWTRTRRHHIFAWISARAKRTLRAMDAPVLPDVRRAWRHAVESWLRRQGLIEISINRNCVTPFSHKTRS